ncbi:hypothetical protein [Ottowia thiooxydans]|uniref:hypothetical protein n=1 Tax=Ottowia thiooxydans TaxID=219182 RepID=UPI00048AECA8|nr:hypothetical protein [Ottowia thiooxydans]
MLLVLGFLAFLGIGYLCFKGFQAIGAKRSMGNQDWLRKKLAGDSRFSQADKLSVLDESALAFHSRDQKIYLAQKEVDWILSKSHPRKHNGWKVAIKDYSFADFVSVEQVDNDFEPRHILLCGKVRSEEVRVAWGHTELVNALKPLLTSK